VGIVTGFCGSTEGADVTYTYDALGRLQHADYASKTVTYNFDHAGNRKSIVTGANGVPTANNDSARATGGHVTLDPRYNDTDPDGDNLSISAPGSTAVATANGGSVTGNGTSVSYHASAPGYAGSDSFNYTINDGHGHSASATVSLTVTANLPPTVNNDSYEFATTQALDPLINDSDPDSDPLTITGVSRPAHGTATIGSDRTFVTYTVTGPYTGTDSFTYTVSDGWGGHSVNGTISVTIDGSGGGGCPTC
jgi:YD repeat-containing protein